FFFFFFSSRRRHTRLQGDWSSDVCSSDLDHLVGDCRYLAPTDEVIVLPINNTSAENFAAWIGRNLHQRLKEAFGEVSVSKLRVRSEERRVGKECRAGRGRGQ